MGRFNYTTPAGLDSSVNKIEYHMLRLGLTTKASIAEMFDIEAEIAAVPYAMIQGSYGAFEAPAVIAPATLGSPAELSGWLYGATAEVMARFRPDEHWSLGLGGRAWYLTGQADVAFETSSGRLVGKTQQFSTFRYGLLGEVSYKF
jgi:hypothetical protein